MHFALGNLPTELVQGVGECLNDGDLSSLSRTCRDLHKVFTSILYRRQELHHELMYHCVERGNIGAVRNLLKAGASPNIIISSEHKRTSTCVLPLYSLHEHIRIKLIQEESDESDESNQSNQSNQAGRPNRAQLRRNRVRPLPYSWTLVHVAVGMGRDDIISLLLQYGAKIDTVSKGFCECLLPNEALLPHPRHYCAPNWAPLHAAICHGHESTVRLLLSHGVSTGVSPDCYGITALHTACFSNRVPIIRLLLNEGHQTDINVQDYKGHTPMSYAYFANNWRSIDFLVKAGASLNVNLGSYSLIEHACLCSWFYDALRLINLGVDLAKSCAVEPEATDTGSALLFRCCKVEELLKFDVQGRLRLSYGREFDQERFRTNVIRALIKAGANMEVRCLQTESRPGDRTMTPLMLASKYSLSEVVETLLAAGADIEAVDDDGYTASMMVCRPQKLRFRRPEEAKLRTVTLLLTHKPQSSDSIRRALKMALGFCSDIEIVKLFIKHAKPGMLDDKDSFQLLGDAMGQANYDVANLLIGGGLRKPTSVEIDSIIENSIKFGNPMAMVYLSSFPQSHGPLRDPNRLLNCIKRRHNKCAQFMIKLKMPDNCEIFLVEACRVGNFEIAELLLEKGADPNKPSGTDYPLDKAILGNHRPVVRLFLDHGVVVGHRGFRALDLAIEHGKKDVVKMICTHASYRATKTEHTAHLETACSANWTAFDNGDILDLLLKSANPNVVLPTATVTPLHLCIARGHDRAIHFLLKAGADIHMRLDPDDRPSAPAINSSWGTTPLEWAISNSSRHRVGLLLGFPSRLSLRKLWHPQQEMVQLHYIRAACRRADPEVISLLLQHELPFELRDDKGNSFLSIFCQTIESIWPLGDPNEPADLRRT